MSPASYQTAPPRAASDRRSVRWYDLPSFTWTATYRPTVLPSSRPSRAGNGTRTRDPNLGKVVLYQLSYSRKTHRRQGHVHSCPAPSSYRPTDLPPYRPSGGEGNRTPDLVNAIHALSQLSYAPVILDALASVSSGNMASYPAPGGVSRRRGPLRELPAQPGVNDVGQ